MSIYFSDFTVTKKKNRISPLIPKKYFVTVPNTHLWEKYQCFLFKLALKVFFDTKLQVSMRKTCISLGELAYPEIAVQKLIGQISGAIHSAVFEKSHSKYLMGYYICQDCGTLMQRERQQEAEIKQTSFFFVKRESRRFKDVFHLYLPFVPSRLIC